MLHAEEFMAKVGDAAAASCKKEQSEAGKRAVRLFLSVLLRLHIHNLGFFLGGEQAQQNSG